MKIDGKEVEFRHDGIKVGCTTVSKEDIELILKTVNETKRAFVLDLKECSDDKHNHDDIKKARELNRHNDQFLNKRNEQNYKNHGFFLDVNNEWVIVKDDNSCYVLVRREDVLDPKDIVGE